MRRFTIFLPVFCCLLVAPVVASEEASVHPFLTGKYSIDIGVFSPTKELAFRADGTAGVPGSDIDFDEQFDLGQSEDVFARSFDTDPQYDYGIGVGLHWLNIGAFIERDLIISFGETSAVSASGPLPNIGTWYYYSPSEKWYVGGRLDWFEASVADYSGGLVNFAVGANYQLFEYFGVGVKYQIFTLDVDVDKNGWRGRADAEYEGLFIHISGNW